MAAKKTQESAVCQVCKMEKRLDTRHLHEKLDHLLMNQWQRLLEIQEIQTELTQGLAHKLSLS